MVTDEQFKLLRRKQMEGKTQEQAAAAAGMCVKTARRWSAGALPSERVRERHWRTRADPFADVWGRQRCLAPVRPIPETMLWAWFL